MDRQNFFAAQTRVIVRQQAQIRVQLGDFGLSKSAPHELKRIIVQPLLHPDCTERAERDDVVRFDREGLLKGCKSWKTINGFDV